MGTQAILTVLGLLTAKASLSEVTVLKALSQDNAGAESAVRLYRNIPVYASSSPYAAYSIQIPTFTTAPKASASRIIPVKEIFQNNGYLRDSYGNRFVGTPQSFTYKAAVPQQFLQLQELPSHLSQPLVAAAPNYQYKQPSPFVANSHYTLPLQGISAQRFNAPQEVAYPGIVNNIAPTVSHHAQIFGHPTAQQQSTSNKAVYTNVHSQEQYQGLRNGQPFQRLQEIPKNGKIIQEDASGHNKEIFQKDKEQLQEIQEKDTLITTVVNGERTVIKLKTKPTLPLLDISLLEPLTFDNPLVPQVQHFLPRIHQATYHKLPKPNDSKKYHKEFAIRNPKSYDNGKGKQPKESRNNKHHRQSPESDTHDREDAPIHPTVTLKDAPEISYEINSPNYKETYKEQAISYNKETQSEPEHYTYGTKTENEPLHYSYANNNKEPLKVKEVHYVNNGNEPKQLIYNIQTIEHPKEQNNKHLIQSHKFDNSGERDNSDEEESLSLRPIQYHERQDEHIKGRPVVYHEHQEEPASRRPIQYHERQEQPVSRTPIQNHERQEQHISRTPIQNHERQEQQLSRTPIQNHERQEQHVSRTPIQNHERQEQYVSRTPIQNHEHQKESVSRTPIQNHERQEQPVSRTPIQYHGRQEEPVKRRPNENNERLEEPPNDHHDNPEHREVEYSHPSNPTHPTELHNNPEQFYSQPRKVSVVNAEQFHPITQYEENIRIVPEHKTAHIKVDPSQHIQSSQSPHNLLSNSSPRPQERSHQSRGSNNYHDDQPHPSPRPHNAAPQHIQEKSRRIIIQEETPEEMHMLREQVMAEMIDHEENNEEDFENAYNNAAYGFPAYRKETVDTEKEIYNDDSYGVPRDHSDYDIEQVPFEQYQDEGDEYPKTTRGNYKDARDKTKEDYYLDFAVSRPESLTDRYRNKVDYYKLYKEQRPERYFAKNDDRKKEKEKYTSSQYVFKPVPERKVKQFAEYKAAPQIYEYNYSKQAPRDNSAYASRPLQQYKTKTHFVEPQFQYGFEPIAIPRLFDGELAALATNNSPESEKPGMRKKVYKENWYIKKTRTAGGNNS